MKSLARAVALALCLLVHPPPASAAEVAADTTFAFPDDAKIRTELRAFIDRNRGAPGVVVGILEPGGRRVIAEGRSGRPERPQLDGATRFEIGSISKTFTGVLFADMLLAGEVSADQRIGELFPRDLRFTNDADRVTLEQLATHGSGLPRLPLTAGSLSRVLSVDPYRGSTTEGIFRSVATCPDFLIRRPGGFVYSNLGFALLGRLLEVRAGRPYEALLRDRVLDPMGLGGIGVAHVGKPPAELARGHSRGGRPVPYWHLDGYTPAGGLIASTDEMLLYLAHQLEGRLPAVVEAQRSRRRLGDSSGIGLAWHHDSIAGRRMIWHNGATGGFRSFAAFLPDQRRAVVVLANGRGNVDALARRLIDPGARALRTHRPSASGIATTLGLIAWGPLMVLAGILGRRSRSARTDRLDLLLLVLSAAIGLVCAERSGAWLDHPFAAWWGSLAVVVAGNVWLLANARALPWLRPGRWSAIGRLLVVAMLSGAMWLLFQ